MAVNASTKKLYRFGEFLIDAKNRLLLRGCTTVPITPKAFDLLLLFVENPGALIEKQELMERVWGGTFVEEGNLARNVSSLRKALGEQPKDPEYLVTVPGRGYRFVAHVEELSNGDAQSAIQKTAGTGTAVKSKGPTVSADEPAASASPVPKEQSRKWTRPFAIAIGVLVTLVAVGLSPVFLRSKKAEPGTPQVTLKTIAVLPSEPGSAEDRDPAAEFGLAASLIEKLKGVRSFVVRPESAIVKYASIEQDPIEAGKELQVNYILASSYQKSGDKLVMTARLFDVQNGSVLWSDSCEEQCNTFAWQDSLAEKTAHSLLIALSDANRLALTKHGTENKAAYDLYSLALYGWYQNNYDIEGLKRNAEFLEQAIALDPSYAPAYAMLATINSRIGQAVGAERAEYERKAGQLARRALELDETVIQAHLALGVSAYSYYWNWKEAEDHFKRARELNPNDVEVVRTYAAYLASLGKLDESVFWQQLACELQPVSFDLNAVLVKRLFIARRFDEAIQQARKAQQMNPAAPTLYYVWRSYEQQRMYEEAFRALQQSLAAEKDHATAELVERTYAAAGYDKAREVYLKRRLRNLENRAQREDFNPIEPAVACALLGNRDDAFKWLERAYQARVQALIYLKVDPDLDSLRSDPRLENLIQRIGFPQ